MGTPEDCGLIDGSFLRETVVGLVDGMYAVMATPTMISALLLVPRVNAEAQRYFAEKHHIYCDSI